MKINIYDLMLGDIMLCISDGNINMYVYKKETKIFFKGSSYPYK